MRYSNTKQNSEVIQLKNGLFMLYDHVLRNNGKIVVNKGSWGKDQVGKRRVTCDDMQRFCMYNNHNCRIMDLGKKIISLIIPNEKPIFLCSYHYFEHALIDRFTERGEMVEDSWHP